MIWLAMTFVFTGTFCAGYALGRRAEALDEYCDTMLQFDRFQREMRSQGPTPHYDQKGTRGSGNSSPLAPDSSQLSSDPTDPRGGTR